MTLVFRSTSASFGVGAAAGALVVASTLGLFDPHGDLVVVAITLCAAAVLMQRAASIGSDRRRSWFFIGLGAIVLSGALFARITSGTADQHATRSAVPVLLGLLGYGLIGVGLWMWLVRCFRRRSERRDVVLDGAIAATAVFLLSWLSVFSPAHESGALATGLAVAAMVFSPLSAAFLVMTLAIGSRMGERRPVSVRLGTFAAAAFALGDLGFAFAATGAVSLNGQLLTLPYGLSAVALLSAGLHPSLATATPLEDAPVLRPSQQRIALAAAATMSVQAIVLIVHDFSNTADRLVIIAASVVLAVLGTTRIVRTLVVQARLERRLRHQAVHDALTGLFNRFGVLEHLNRLAATGTAHSVIMADIDGFKLVNDASGHHIGDEVLTTMARRLEAACRSSETIARLGGDTFVIITTRTDDAFEAMQFAEKLRVRITDAVEVGDLEIPISLSMGVTTSESGSDPEDLIREADTAVNQAKELGRSIIVRFDRTMAERIVLRSALERELRNVVERGELEVYYQPVADLATGRVAGFEALLRWNHPERGLVSPLEFIPVAEETGDIIAIGSWVLDTALADLARWRESHPANASLWVSVNVSARQLRDRDFVYMVRRALNRHRIEPSGLCLEITESTMIDQELVVEQVLTAIRAGGVRLAIDDFGTGYSSLAYVQRYPFTAVKIDRSFVELLDTPGNEGQLVGAIIAMANALGCAAIAEGVETLEQANGLLDLGCTIGQGFYYARPLRAPDIPTALMRMGVRNMPSIVPSSA